MGTLSSTKRRWRALLIVLGTLGATAALTVPAAGAPAAFAAAPGKPRSSTTTSATTSRVSTNSSTSSTSSTTTVPATTTTAPPAPTSVPSSVVDLTAAATPATDQAVVTWSPPATGWGATTDSVSLQILDLSAGWQQFGQIVTCYVGGVCDGSLTLRGLTNGHQYLAVAWPTNAVGAGIPVASNAFTADTGCTVGACVTVDATAGGQPFRDVASGLNGGGIIPQNSSLLDDLHVSWWRLATMGLPGGPNPPDYTAFDTARTRGAQIIEVLSDDWWEQTWPSNGGAAPNPASNWTAWDTFVKAKVAQSIADGRSPDYWEVWNEPGGNNPPVVGGPLTADQALEIYAHTWNDIKAVDPTAKVAYAATIGFGTAPNQVPAAIAAQYLPIPQLLDYIQQHGLSLDLLTWHENGAPQVDSIGPFAQAVTDRAATARHWLDQRGMTATKINVDEYLPPAVVDDPAWNLAYEAALEQSPADGAARSCWARTYLTGPWGPGPYLGCNWGQLDNLADLGGQNPMAAWWVLKLYSNLHGKVVPAASSSSYLATLATTDGSTTTVLLGQNSTCSGEIRALANPFCPLTWMSAPAMNVSVRVHLPSAGNWTLTQTDVPNVVDALPALPTPTTSVVSTDANGWASVPVTAADGAVTQLAFTPAS